MNATSNTFEIECEDNQISEVVASIFHTILLHRSFGKFQYRDDGNSYTPGTLGYEEITCDFVDFTYIRCASPSFVDSINKEVKSFADKLREDRTNQSGQVTLEFYSKKKARWSFVEDSFRWEFWTVRIDAHQNHSRNKVTTQLEEVLLEKIISIVQIVNSSRIYLPPMPTQKLLTTVFDTSFPDVQPYLFKIRFDLENKNDPRLSSGKPWKQIVNLL